MPFDLFLSSDPKYKGSLIFLGIIVSLLMIACSWYSAPIPQLLFGHDLFLLLDCGWRWKFGILPHHDYCSVMDVVTCMLVSLGIKLGGGFPMALPVAVSLFAVCILPIAIYVPFTRLPPFLALLSSVALLATALAPHALRWEAGDLTYATIYNRWGYCFFLIAFLAIAIPSPGKTASKEAIDGVIAGSLMVLSVFLKLSYGSLLISAFLGFALITARRPVYFVAAIASLVPWMILFGSVTKWDFYAFAHDMKVLAQARSQSYGLNAHGLINAYMNLSPHLCLFLMMGILGCAATFWYDQKPSIFALFRISIIPLSCIFYALMIVTSNAQNGALPESPVFSIGSLIILAEIIRSRKTAGQAPEIIRSRLRATIWLLTLPGLLLALTLALRFVYSIVPRHVLLAYGAVPLFVLAFVPLCFAFVTRQKGFSLRPVGLTLAGYLVMLALVGSVTTRNIEGLLIAFRYKQSGAKLPADQTFQSGPLKGIQISGNEGENPTSYVEKIQEGLRLLDSTGNSQKTVADFDFSNPFDVARGVKPPVGFPLVWGTGAPFLTTPAPDLQHFFSGVDVVMEPKRTSSHPVVWDAIEQTYGGYLREHFTLAGQSLQWFLWQRK